VTKLPFYVGHQGKISVTRQEFPTDLCPKNDCFYMADAFRLTWVSEQCKYGSDGGHSVHDELEEEEDLRMSANSRAELEEEMKKRTKARHAGQAMQQEPEMAVRIVADEFEKLKEEAEHVMFPFQAPMDGCYMLEEMHPHHHKKHHFPKATVPYTVNYCKGRSAQGPLRLRCCEPHGWPSWTVELRGALPLLQRRGGRRGSGPEAGPQVQGQ